jgi:hypothetical protein
MATKQELANIKKLQADVATQKKLVEELTTKAVTAGQFADTAVTKAEVSSDAAAGIPVIKTVRQTTPPQAPAGYTYQWISLPGAPGSGEYRLTQNAPTGIGNTSGNTGGGKPTGLKTEAQIAAEAEAAARQAGRQSAYDLLYAEFAQYGLQSLVDPLKGLIVSGASPAEFTIKLRESEPYQKRFAGNAKRIANGLMAIDERTYLATEDKYQALMRNYGLPQSYWSKDTMGTQEGFTNLIANDVSSMELEGRLQAAQTRVLNANPEVAYALKAFYPDINNGDILAYALDPQNALDKINRKVTAAEIGGAALSQGLMTSAAGAEGLAAYGISKEQAQQGYQSVAGVLPRGSQLASIYGENPYTQATAEAEVFGTIGAAEARKQREKLVGLEKGAFSGSAGMAGGALSRDRAATQSQRSSGAGAF